MFMYKKMYSTVWHNVVTCVSSGQILLDYWLDTIIQGQCRVIRQIRSPSFSEMTSPGVTNEYDVYSRQEDCQRAHEMIDLLYTTEFEKNKLCIQEQLLKLFSCVRIKV